MRARRGVTLIEILVGMALAALAFGIIYEAMHLFFGSGSRHNVVGMTKRSFVQKDAKSGLRRLTYRLREAIQILSPEGGKSAPELVFRDLTNSEIRLRLIADQKRVISERKVGAAWVAETDPDYVNTTTGGRMVASWPVVIQNCTDVRFTAIAPDCVTVQASLEWEGQVGPLMTVVKLRNAQLGY